MYHLSQLLCITGQPHILCGIAPAELAGIHGIAKAGTHDGQQLAQGRPLQYFALFIDKLFVFTLELKEFFFGL